MMKELKPVLDDHMNKAIKSLHNQMSKVRTGRATAAVLDGIQADYYGSATPIKNMAKYLHQKLVYYRFNHSIKLLFQRLKKLF